VHNVSKKPESEAQGRQSGTKVKI